MDTAQQFSSSSGLAAYQLPAPAPHPPHTASNDPQHPAFLPWQQTHLRQPDASPPAHAQMTSIMSHVQHQHPHPDVQQSFVPRLLPDYSSNGARYTSADHGPSMHQMSSSESP